MSIARSAGIYFTLTKENDVVNGLRCREWVTMSIARSAGIYFTLTKENDVINGVTMSIARSARIYFTLTKENSVVNRLRCQSPGLQEYTSPLLRITMSSMSYEVNRPFCKKVFHPY